MSNIQKQLTAKGAWNALSKDRNCYRAAVRMAEEVLAYSLSISPPPQNPEIFYRGVIVKVLKEMEELCPVKDRL